MKNIHANRIFTVIIILSIAFIVIGTGCYSKKCGCGPDLNGLYKVKRRNRTW